MKKLYYFSKSKLQFVKISRFLTKNSAFNKPFMVISLLTISFLSLVFAFLLLFRSGNPGIKNENRELKEKLVNISALYSNLDRELDSLIQLNNQLRIAANLPVLSTEEQKLGVGGGFYDNLYDFSSKEIREINNAVDDISRKIKFEKNNFNIISGKIEENRKLFASIPAIKPCNGIISEHGFGMRIHPILKVNIMHDGLDIITDIGTPVHVSGKGIVDFIGYKNGYGLAIEVDHGFGYRTLYAHLSAAKVKVGQSVTRGEIIAESGNSGLSSGPHLHYEVIRDGIKQDPSYFFFDEISNSNLVKLKGNNL